MQDKLINLPLPTQSFINLHSHNESMGKEKKEKKKKEEKKEKEIKVPAGVPLLKRKVVKGQGIFNMNDLYLELYLWFTHHGYKWKELEYKILEFGGGKKRSEILWECSRKVDDYTTYVIDLAMAADTSDQEVTLEGGKKVKRQKATLEFITTAEIKYNKDIWKGKPLAQYQAKVYTLLIHDRLEGQKGELWEEVHKLIDELKAFMIIYQ